VTFPLDHTDPFGITAEEIISKRHYLADLITSEQRQRASIHHLSPGKRDNSQCSGAELSLMSPPSKRVHVVTSTVTSTPTAATVDAEIPTTQINIGSRPKKRLNLANDSQEATKRVTLSHQPQQLQQQQQPQQVDINMSDVALIAGAYQCKKMWKTILHKSPYCQHLQQFCTEEKLRNRFRILTADRKTTKMVISDLPVLRELHILAAYDHLQPAVMALLDEAKKQADSNL